MLSRYQCHALRLPSLHNSEPKTHLFSISCLVCNIMLQQQKLDVDTVISSKIFDPGNKMLPKSLEVENSRSQEFALDILN